MARVRTAPRACDASGRGRLSSHPDYGTGQGWEVPGKGSRFSTRRLNHGKTEQSVVVVMDWAAPGVTHLGLFPEYNVEPLDGLFKNLKAQGVHVESAGR